MLQYMVTKDHIKTMVGKGQVADVRFHIRQRRIEVGRGIFDVFQPSEPFVKGLFRGKVQNLVRFGEEIRFVFEIKPKQAVPFQGERGRREYIFPRIFIAVRKEAPETLAINGVGKVFSL